VKVQRSRLKDLQRAVLPQPMRHAVRRRVDTLREYAELPQRLERLETLMLESHDRIHERSQRRWARAAPAVDLTFGRALTGDAFVTKAAQYGAFGEGRIVVEIGPGYGRLPEAALRHGIQFQRWIGVDLSAQNVSHLRERFSSSDDRFEFVQGNAESVALQEKADTLVSSLTLKHFYPSFEAALANAAGQMRDGGTIVIDLIEGERRYFEDDAETYIRWYQRDEVRAIFERCGCEVTAFDVVEHDADHHRLLVVGRRSG
jgi:SAM-dependent methyltransferase